MKRLTMFLAAIAALTAVAGPTAASEPELFATADSAVALAVNARPTALTSGADIRAVGGGKTSLGMESFDLSAHTGPQGDFGHYGTKVYNPVTGELIARYKVDVDCVNVHGPGERAVIKGLVKSVEPTPNALGVDLGERVILGVDDESNPGDAVPLDDWFNPHSDTFPGDCKNIVYIANVNNVTQGYVNIKPAE